MRSAKRGHTHTRARPCGDQGVSSPHQSTTKDHDIFSSVERFEVACFDVLVDQPELVAVLQRAGARVDWFELPSARAVGAIWILRRPDTVVRLLTVIAAVFVEVACGSAGVGNGVLVEQKETVAVVDSLLIRLMAWHLYGPPSQGVRTGDSGGAWREAGCGRGKQEWRARGAVSPLWDAVCVGAPVSKRFDSGKVMVY